METDRPLLDAFETVVHARKDAIALVWRAVQISFGELDRAANQMAHRLCRLGVGPEQNVAVCIERSPAAVLGVLAVLKTGAAYVPLSPREAPQRLERMLASARPTALLLGVGEVAPIATDCPIVACGFDAPSLALESGEPLPLPACPERAVYVLYTSGSTGEPKGVIVPERALANHMRWMSAEFGFGADERIAFKTALTFDASVWELFAPLLGGGLLVIAEPCVERDPQELSVLLARHEVTTVQFVPALLEACLALGALSGLPALRRVFCGGDRLLRSAVRAHASACSAELYNLYGPTEATIDTTCMEANPSVAPSVVELGRPITGAQLYTLDGRMEHAPPCEEAELFIGGAGLARGYVGDAAATAERFLPDCLGGRAGARMYRSGDWGTQLSNGLFTFHGRRDELVKVRGQRVELGEVRVAVLALPCVRDAVVVVRSIGGEKALVAYVRTHAGVHCDSQVLRDALRDRLPAAMIPHSLVAIESIPLNAHGKLDVAALPSLPAAAASRSDQLDPGASREQAALADIWATVLGIARPAADDNFFQLGGDSIRSIKVVSLAKRQGMSISVADVFRTLRELAASAARAPQDLGSITSSSPFSLVCDADRAKLPASAEDAYPLSSIQKALYFLSQTSARYEIYVTSFEVKGTFCQQAMAASLALVVERHPWLRTRIHASGFREPIQIVQRNARVPLQQYDLTHLAPAAQQREVLAWIDEQRSRRFDWRSDSFLEVTVHRRGLTHFQITFIEPVFDGWSLATLVAQVFSIYAALVRGLTPPGAPMSDVTYRDFIALERDAVASAEHQDYWRAALDDWPDVRLPRAGPGARARHGNPVGRELVVIPPEVSEVLQRLAVATSIPLKSLLFAAHAKVIGFITGRPDAVSGMMVNGRPEKTGGDALLGIFLNTLPLRLPLYSEPWLALARRAFEAERTALPFRRYPTAVMQAKSEIEPLFEAAFNFTHFHVRDALRELEELEIVDYLAWDQTFFPLMAQFHVNASNRKILLALDYDRAEFAAEIVRAWARYYERALRALATEPERDHFATPLVGDHERCRTMARANGPTLGARELAPLEVQFERAERQAPDAIAIQAGDLQLTYHELGARARILAAELRRHGVGIESRVAVCVERSIELVIALRAVLHAGAAYVPIDPSLPDQRVERLLRDAEPALVLCDNRSFVRVPRELPTLVLDQTATGRAPSGEPVLLDPPAPAAALAYLMYTSGSSGAPKAVMVPRSALANFLYSITSRPGLHADDRVLATTPVTFDIAALELLAPLTVGARVLVVDREQTLDGRRLLTAIDEHRVTVMQGTPSNWQLLVRAGFGGIPHLRMFSGGEKLTAQLASSLLQEGGELWNLYGPTETTVWSAVHRVRDEDAEIPLGRPIHDTTLVLLDYAFELAPAIGSRAELYIGGGGVARGYSRDPARTADAFRPAVFATRDGSRLYRSGDLAFYDLEGALHYARRQDEQIKLRGVRIEPGEIEALLRKHRYVIDATVRVVRSPAAADHLVAYVVLDPRDAASGPALRSYLQERLPEQLVPTHVVPVERLPLTRHGKLDVQALPDPFVPGRRSEHLERLLRQVETLTDEQVRDVLATTRRLQLRATAGGGKREG